MYNPFSLEGKTVLVTGASSGIGRGIAIECSKMGAKVILNGRNQERLKQTLSSLEGEGHICIAADLSQQKDIDRLAAELPELNGWVNSAGIPKISPIKRFKREDIDEIFNVNSISTMMLLSRLVKLKKIKRGSSVVFISSISGAFVGSVADTAYCATKGAVAGFLKGASLELAAQGIRVNSINPGLVPTEILNLSNSISGDEHHVNIMAEHYPMKRLGKPEDMAYGAIYLLSDASTWVTGHQLVIDGGYTIA